MFKGALIFNNGPGLLWEEADLRSGELCERHVQSGHNTNKSIELE